MYFTVNKEVSLPIMNCSFKYYFNLFVSYFIFSVFKGNMVSMLLQLNALDYLIYVISHLKIFSKRNCPGNMCVTCEYVHEAPHWFST